MPDSTKRLLQILRTSLALIKYYEGHPDSAASMMELKKSMQCAIDDLTAIEAGEDLSEWRNAGDSVPDVDLAELDLKRIR